MAHEIECEARECLHNGEGKCDAHGIQVRGGATYNSSKTYCNTFTDNPKGFVIEKKDNVRDAPRSPGGDFDVEAAAELAQTTPDPITCTAVKCRHNRDYICSADSVSMKKGGKGVVCDTFDA